MVDTMMVDGEAKTAAEEAPARVSRAELEAQVARLSQALVEMTEVRDRLTTEVGTAQTERLRAQADLRTFQQLVVQVAVQEAEDRDWCDEIRGIIEDKLGLEWPQKWYEASVNVTLTFRAAREAGLPTTDWVRESVRFDTSYTDNGYALVVALDDDNQEVSVVDYEVDSVDSVEAVEGE